MMLLRLLEPWMAPSVQKVWVHRFALGPANSLIVSAVLVVVRMCRIQPELCGRWNGTCSLV